jgi:hypothetical protein
MSRDESTVDESDAKVLSAEGDRLLRFGPVRVTDEGWPGHSGCFRSDAGARKSGASRLSSAHLTRSVERPSDRVLTNPASAATLMINRLPARIVSGSVALTPKHLVETNLLAADGFLYEAPVAYYSAARGWDLAPGYNGYAYPYLTRPVLPGCLSCHASFLEPVSGTQNRFTRHRSTGAAWPANAVTGLESRT